MKKIITVLIVFSLAGVPFMGCAAKFGRYDPEGKQALRTLAAGAAGALIVGNTGGAIVCAFVSDIYNATTTKYNDKKLENGEEAAERYKDRYKVEEKKKRRKKKKPLPIVAPEQDLSIDLSKMGNVETFLRDDKP